MEVIQADGDVRAAVVGTRNMKYLTGFVIGCLVTFTYLMGHMLHHDTLYHDTSSKFGTQGVFPFYQPATNTYNVVNQQVEDSKTK